MSIQRADITRQLNEYQTKCHVPPFFSIFLFFLLKSKRTLCYQLAMTFVFVVVSVAYLFIYIYICMCVCAHLCNRLESKSASRNIASFFLSFFFFQTSKGEDSRFYFAAKISKPAVSFMALKSVFLSHPQESKLNLWQVPFRE